MILLQYKLKSTHNQRKSDLMWFGNVLTSTERKGEIFIENREENIRVTRRSLSLTTLNGDNMKFS